MSGYLKVPSDIALINDQIISLTAGLTAYFFYNEASDISTYLQMTTTPSTGSLETLTTAGVVNDQLLASFATNSTFPNLTYLPSGVVKIHINAAKTSGLKTAQIYAKLFKRAAGGTETLLATTENTDSLTGTNTAYIIDTTLPIGQEILATDRIVVKIYAYVSGITTAPTIALYCEEDTIARLELPVSAIGYTPENIANKSTDGTLSANSDTLYPSQKAVKTYVDSKDKDYTMSFLLMGG